ncbi:protein SRG1-like [Cornus florida]|uniref:protein SRG1-like n=1 Tax=Cornus florida TaxID=4283 RepID=UPI0028A01237|nr:protein SRG1-like [Cornus florida]XP_059667380.1 protein SRG1-like [Cornus florida]XP_059667381.1 protein SRG1-like [Cornus florida]
MAPEPISPIKTGYIHDVQELGKAKSVAIPERFVRDMAERPTDVTVSSSSSIPVIDVSKLLKGSKDEFHTELLKLSTSCKDWGFFQVINHGIDLVLLESMEKVVMEFFMLPLEEKQKYPMVPGIVHGYGQALVFSEEQKLDWCNMLALIIEPHHLRNPKLWPTTPVRFSDTIEEYSREMKRLCQNLLKFIATTLGLKQDIFGEMFGETMQAVRMNYYPPCPRPDLVIGLSPHSDGSALTVLQQTGSTVGLQILKDNKWVSVQPIPNALVINIGDTIEVLTNGLYKSVEHRAVTHNEKDRLSIVTFYAPNPEVELGPMPELVDQNNPCKYRRYNYGEYSQHYLADKLQGKKRLEYAMIQTS